VVGVLPDVHAHAGEEGVSFPTTTCDAWWADYRTRVDAHNHEAEAFPTVPDPDADELAVANERGDILRAQKVEVVIRLQRCLGALLLTPQLADMSPQELDLSPATIQEYQSLATRSENLLAIRIGLDVEAAHVNAPWVLLP
jgi:hypothetical protein